MLLLRCVDLCVLLIFIILSRINIFIATPPPIGERSKPIDVTVSVCMSLSTGISPELHVRSSSNFLRMLAMSVARSSYGGVAIRFVHPAAGSDIYNCFVHFVYLAYPLFARGSENWCVVFPETLIQRQC